METHVDVFIAPTIHVFCATRYQQKNKTAPFSPLFLPHFLSLLSLSLPRFTDQVDPSNRAERPRSTLTSLTSEFSAGFRSASAAAAVAPRTRADTRSSGGYGLKGRRARFNKSNTTDRQMEHARTENGTTKRARANTSLLLPVCLPACLPASCLVASFGGEQPAAPTLFVSRVACLHVDSLFTRFPPSSEPIVVSHPSRGLALTTRSSLSPALYHSPSLSVSPTLLYLSLSLSLTCLLSLFLSLCFSLSVSLAVCPPVFTVPNKARFIFRHADKIIGLPEKRMCFNNGLPDLLIWIAN